MAVKEAFGKKMADILVDHRHMEHLYKGAKGSNQRLREENEKMTAAFDSPFTAQIGDSYIPHPVHEDVFNALKALPGAEIKKWKPCEVIVREICQPPVDKPVDEE